MIVLGGGNPFLAAPLIAGVSHSCSTFTAFDGHLEPPFARVDPGQNTVPQNAKKQRLGCLVAGREPVDDFFSVLVERPEIAMLKEQRVRLLELLQEGSGRLRKSFRQILIVGFEKISKRYSHLTYAQFFAVFLHYT